MSWPHVSDPSSPRMFGQVRYHQTKRMTNVGESRRERL
jgi:hypothetical protein